MHTGLAKKIQTSEKLKALVASDLGKLISTIRGW